MITMPVSSIIMITYHIITYHISHITLSHITYHISSWSHITLSQCLSQVWSSEVVLDSASVFATLQYSPRQTEYRGVKMFQYFHIFNSSISLYFFQHFNIFNIHQDNCRFYVVDESLYFRQDFQRRLERAKEHPMDFTAISACHLFRFLHFHFRADEKKIQILGRQTWW